MSEFLRVIEDTVGCWELHGGQAIASIQFTTAVGNECFMMSSVLYYNTDKDKYSQGVHKGFCILIVSAVYSACS